MGSEVGKISEHTRVISERVLSPLLVASAVLMLSTSHWPFARHRNIELSVDRALSSRVGHLMPPPSQAFIISRLMALGRRPMASMAGKIDSRFRLLVIALLAAYADATGANGTSQRQA